MQDASAMYLEAVEVMEDEGQETMALDIFRQAIGQPTFCLPCFLGLGRGLGLGAEAGAGVLSLSLGMVLSCL